MKIHCLQHVPFEGPAAIGAWAALHGFSVSITRLFANEPFPAPDAFDLLIVLGGPMSVNDEERFDWLGPETRFVEQAMARGKHVMGICLGAQLIARALGAKVYPNTEREIGWLPVQRTSASGGHAAFSTLPENFMALHWHGETFDLPAGATWLARSDACQHQAFATGPNVLALQFHLESTPESVEALVQNCPGDLAPGPCVSDAAAMLSAHDHFRRSNQLMADLLDRFAGARRQGT